MPIEVPSPGVISKIDAGEVVETASSAVTKLVENSINAGVTEGSVGISHICIEHLGGLFNHRIEAVACVQNALFSEKDKGKRACCGSPKEARQERGSGRPPLLF